MSTEDNKDVLLRFSDVMKQFWATGDVSLFDGILTPNYIQHWPGFPPDRAGYLRTLQVFRAAFPDLTKTTEETLADRDLVMDRVTVQATHTGEFLGLPPKGKRVAMSEMHIARIVDGMIVERWGEWDLRGLLEQLGMVSSPLTTHVKTS